MLKKCAFLLLSGIWIRLRTSKVLVHSHSFAIAIYKKVEISACMGAKCNGKNKQLSLLTQTIVMLYVIRIGNGIH